MERIVNSTRHLASGPATWVSILSLLTLALTGCPGGEFRTDQEQLTFMAPDLHVGAVGGFSGGPILEGTPICAECTGVVIAIDGETDLELSCGDGGEYDALACFDQSVEGGALDEAGCVIADAPGQVTWSFSPTSCPVVDAGAQLVPDQVSFTFAARDDVEGSVEQWLEEGATAWFEAGVLAQPDGSGFDESLRNPAGEPFRVVAGEPFRFWVQLVDPDTAQPVAWQVSDGHVELATLQGDEATVLDVADGSVELSLTEGSETEIRLVVGLRTWSAGRVVGVDPEDIDSLDLVAAVNAEGQEGAGTPFAARAVLRDGEGRPVYGAPVTWKVTGGQLAFDDGILDLPGGDYVELADSCIAPSDTSTRKMTLKASYRGMTDKEAFSWTPARSEESADDEGWEPHESCTGGCSCRSDSSTATAPAAAAALGLAGLLAARRRR